MQMFAALFIIALSLKFIKNGDKTGRDKNNQPKVWEAWYVLAFTCLFDNAYCWSWGPLGALCCMLSVLLHLSLSSECPCLYMLRSKPGL